MAQDLSTTDMPNPLEYPEGFPYRSRESAETKFGMELDKVRTKIQSDEGRRELIQQLNLNGNADTVLEGIDLNVEQLKKKESFFMKMLKLPGRAVKSAFNVMGRHPFLTSAAVIAIIIAILYFTPALAPTAGEYGTKLVQAFKGTLAKIGVGTPEAATDAISKLPITGGSVPPEVVREAEEILQSPGMMDELGRVIEGLSQ